MKIVVTGGTGLMGQHVIEDLLSHNYEVLNADITIPPNLSSNPTAPYKQVNMEDFGQVLACLNGYDMVVHLAAIPRPTYHTNEVVFRTNVIATYNVFEAAYTLGIKKIIYASSVSVLGYPFYNRYFAPQYIPIDENHPNQPQDPYAMSKYIGEEIAKAFVRRCEMNVISLRLVWIHTPQTFRSQLMPMWDRPEDGASNLWSYVDGRDAAQACRLALQSQIEGHHSFFISAPNTFMKVPTAQLVKQFYPSSTILPNLAEHQSLINTAKAEKELGFHAQYTWDMYL